MKQKPKRDPTKGSGLRAWKNAWNDERVGTHVIVRLGLQRIHHAFLSISEGDLLECSETTGLLPVHMVEVFYMFRFMAAVARIARQTQKQWGVPASLLIAVAVLDSAWCPTDKDQAGWIRYFASTAKRLLADRQMRALILKTGPGTLLSCWPQSNNLKQLRRFKKLGGYFSLADVEQVIADYGLQACDGPGVKCCIRRGQEEGPTLTFPKGVRRMVSLPIVGEAR